MRSCRLYAARAFSSLLAVLCVFAAQAASADDLPRLNIDPRQISVSGLSSGGYMAAQFEVAYSALVMGAGVIAGGPYFCAQGSLAVASPNCVCLDKISCTWWPTTRNLPRLFETTADNARSGAIDPTSNLRGHRVWMFSSELDSVVRKEVMDDLRAYYSHYVSGGNIRYKTDLGMEHAMPSDSFGPTDCQHMGDPYIINCGFDAAGALLAWIYEPLQGGCAEPRAAPASFRQDKFLAEPASHGLAQEGWIYVPDECRAGTQCRLHVVFHGCNQNPSHQIRDASGQLMPFGTTFVLNAGYNRWSDANRIVVLYPQAEATADNPAGCWDWWAYDDPDYAKKTGRQMAAVKAMIDAIAGTQ